jgi:SMI1 / KNR4 family (SUKH-1)
MSSRMRNLDEIGIRQRPSAKFRHAPTAREVAEFERAFSVKLPSDYLSFLRYCNGGHPRLEFCPLDTNEFDRGVSANIFFFLNSSEKDQTENLWYEMKLHAASLCKELVPIADDGCGNLILLDCRTNPPSVNAEIHDSAKSGIVQVAPTFADFVDRLVEPRS